jgi:hypothetical protein
MIKPGKACSQLMEANYTGKTNIKGVRNIFRHTFVFNALKPSLNLCLSSPISRNLCLIFEIRGVISVKTCLEGDNLVNLTIHAPPTYFIKPHAKYKHEGVAKACFVGISWRHVRQGSMEVSQSKNIKWKE